MAGDQPAPKRPDPARTGADDDDGTGAHELADAPLALLKPVVWSPATRLAMILLRGYLVVSVVLLIVKAIELGSG